MSRIGAAAAGLGMALALALAGAPTGVRAAEFLSPTRLAEELGGKTIKGYYLADKVNFVEAYQADGRISYKDDLKGDVGRWSVRGQAFCTFYATIAGGCWFVLKHSANCLEFHRASDQGTEPVTREDLLARMPHARAARDADKVTCEAWFGS